MSSPVKRWTPAEVAAMQAEDESRERYEAMLATLAEAAGRANTARAAAAAARDVERDRALLAAGGLSPGRERVLRARVDHPDDTLAQLAVRLDTTKDAYAACLRRALRRRG